MANDDQKPRLIPTYVKQLLGQELYKAAKAYMGIRDASLKDFYPWLNVREAVVFAEQSRLLREQRNPEFMRAVRERNIYQAFAMANRIGFPELKSKRLLGQKEQVLDERLNPYTGNLEARLRAAADNKPGSIESLRQELLAEPMRYALTETQDYYNAKAAQEASGKPFTALHFRKEEFPMELAKIINDYERRVDASFIAPKQIGFEF